MYRSDQFMEYARNYLRQQVDQEAIEEVRGIRQLDEMLLLRQQSLFLELNTEKTHIEDIREQIDLTQSQIKSIRRDIEVVTADPNAKATVVSPYYEKLTNLHARLDSLIATREEMKRNYQRIQQELEYMDHQQTIVRQISNQNSQI